MTERADGEAAIIQQFLAPLAAGFPGAFGLSDDCALLSPKPNIEFVLKTDPIRAGIHFGDKDDPADIAWKALAVNASDLAAKGAKPVAYLMALSFPEAPKNAWLHSFADGLQQAQTAFGCHLIGGDTDRAPGPLSITITMIGELPAGQMVRRGTARAGDLIFVSGTIGDSGLGLHARTNDFARRFWPIDAADRTYLANRYLRPQPRLALGQVLRANASAAMDVSDGLAKDLERLAAGSGVQATLEAGKVPMSSAAKKIADQITEWRIKILSVGDDYEILCTVPSAKAVAFSTAAHAAGVPVSEIGRISAGQGLTIIGLDGQPIKLDRKGWDHF